MDTDRPIGDAPADGVAPCGDAGETRALAVCLSLVADLIIEEPREEALRSYVGNRVFEEAPAASRNTHVLRGLELLRGWCEAHAKGGERDLSVAVRALRSEQLRLLKGCGAPLAPCWATFYLDPNNQMLGRETLAVRSVYREFGLRIENPRAEPDDHLALMLRFCAYLLTLEADAIQTGDAAAAADLRSRQRDFLAAHILPWTARWAYLAHKHATSDYYRGAAVLTFGFVEEYALRFGIVYREDARAFVAKRREDC